MSKKATYGITCPECESQFAYLETDGLCVFCSLRSENQRLRHQLGELMLHDQETHEMDGNPVKKTFSYHKPSTGGLERITKLREAFSRLHDLIEEVAPAPSREKSVALTNLETTAMWAIKAVVCNDPESEVA